MEITLKKAHTIQIELENIYNSIVVMNLFAITEFHNPEKFIDEMKSNLEEKIERKISVCFAKYEIRSLIDDKNHGSGISKMLTKIAHLNKNISLWDDVVKSIPDHLDDIDVLKGKLDKISKAEVKQYSRDTVGVVPIKDLDKYKALLSKCKKEKSDLKDKIAAANLNNTVILSDEIVDILKKENII